MFNMLHECKYFKSYSLYCSLAWGPLEPDLELTALQDGSETSVQGDHLNLTTPSVPLHPLALSANQLFPNPVAKQQKDVRTRALLGQGAANLPCEDNTMSFAFR